MTDRLTAEDRAQLRRALQLAEGGRGRVSPNPLVGATIVRDGETIGEGFHARLGDLHAERAALKDCRRRGNDAAGATMYVSLEPCAHEGRQPPCATAVREAGIARVVVAAEDPSAKADGLGPRLLREAGVEVEFADGEEAEAARLLVQPFRKHARTGLPLVTLKLAMSLDGRTATPPGGSPWISGPESRALVHRWRAESDAIAVGIGTALADDPLLTARPDAAEPRSPASGVRNGPMRDISHTAAGEAEPPRQPLRVVFDSAARLPLGSRLLASLEVAPLLVLAGPGADPGRLAALREAGAEVLELAGAGPVERVEEALRELGSRGLTSLFLEGGRTLVSSFVAADQVDEARVFVAPLLLGSGGDAPVEAGPLEGARIAAVASELRRVGEDVLVTARFKEW